MIMWETNGYTYILRGSKSNALKLICCFRPKPTNEYLEYIGKEVFGSVENFKDWYMTKNYWYDDKAPCELPNQEAVDWLMRILHGTPI